MRFRFNIKRKLPKFLNIFKTINNNKFKCFLTGGNICNYVSRQYSARHNQQLQQIPSG